MNRKKIAILLSCFILLVLLLIYGHIKDIKMREKYARDDTSWIDNGPTIYYFNKDTYLSRANLNGTGSEVILPSIKSPGATLFSPDGRYIMLLGNPIRLLDTITLKEKTFLSFAKDYNTHGRRAEFSPLNDKIAIVNLNPPDEKVEYKDLGLFVVDMGTLDTIKIDRSAISKGAEKDSVHDIDIFWSEDGRSVYIYSWVYEPVPEKKEGYVDTQRLYEIYRLDVETRGISLVKEWIRKGDYKAIERVQKEIRDYKNAIPQHKNWAMLKGWASDHLVHKSIDGRYSLQRRKKGRDSELALKDNKTGKEVIIDKGYPDYEAGGSSINSVSFLPGDRFIIYRNLDIREAPRTSFVNWLLGRHGKTYTFVYDIERQKRGRLNLGARGVVFWFDPDFRLRLL